MKITPLDLRKQEFKRAMRGYDVHEVDAFLEMVAKEMEELLRENSVLTERLRELDLKIDDYRNMEKTLQGTLTSAQRTADDLKKNAGKEAELIVRNAKMRATRLVEEARAKVTDLQAEVSALEGQREVFVAKFKSMIEVQQRLLEAHSLGKRRPAIAKPSPVMTSGGVAPDPEPQGGRTSDYSSLGNLFLEAESGDTRKAANPE